MAAQPLYGGSAVHVIDIGMQRIVFAATPRVICVLARYSLERSVTSRKACCAACKCDLECIELEESVEL